MPEPMRGTVNLSGNLMPTKLVAVEKSGKITRFTYNYSQCKCNPVVYYQNENVDICVKSGDRPLLARELAGLPCVAYKLHFCKIT